MVHSYGNDISWTFQSTAIFLAQKGFACFAFDLEGHGRSSDLKALVPNVDLVVQDCLSFFNLIKQDPKFQHLPSFLYEESMGGAICLLIHLVDPEDLMYNSMKVEEKKIIADQNPIRYRGKPILGTAIELLRITKFLGERFWNVKLPLIILHGSADVVTDPEVSRTLFGEAKSEDKKIKIYEGMMHSLLFGETDANVEIVRNDIFSWLDDRCKKL
ncbi:hypothetical protein UlMin_011801 [Ulmus minor]